MLSGIKLVWIKLQNKNIFYFLNLTEDDEGCIWNKHKLEKVLVEFSSLIQVMQICEHPRSKCPGRKVFVSFGGCCCLSQNIANWEEVELSRWGWTSERIQICDAGLTASWRLHLQSPALQSQMTSRSSVQASWDWTSPSSSLWPRASFPVCAALAASTSQRSGGQLYGCVEISAGRSKQKFNTLFQQASLTEKYDDFIMIRSGVGE